MTASTPTAAERHSTASSLSALLREGAGYEAISRHLDALPAAERLAEVLAVTGRGVARLYEAVGDAPALDFDEFVPKDLVKTTVILEGRNSLPMFSRFQKRFYRTEEGGLIVGYNHQTMSFVTGPGYFVVQGPEGKGPHPTEPFFDYTVAAPTQPEGWPAIKPNDRGLSKAVYANMKDYCRRVARGVLVGKAYKLGVSQDAFFTLTKPE